MENEKFNPIETNKNYDRNVVFLLSQYKDAINYIKYYTHPLMSNGMVQFEPYSNQTGTISSNDERGLRGTYNYGIRLSYNNNEGYLEKTLNIPYMEEKSLNKENGIIGVQRSVLSFVCETSTYKLNNILKSIDELYSKKIEDVTNKTEIKESDELVIKELKEKIKQDIIKLSNLPLEYDKKIENTYILIQKFKDKISDDSELIKSINAEVDAFNNKNITRKYDIKKINDVDSLLAFNRSSKEHPIEVLRDIIDDKYKKFLELIELKKEEINSIEKQGKQALETFDKKIKDLFKDEYGDILEFEDKYSKLINDVASVGQLITIILEEQGAPYGKNGKIISLNEQIPSIKEYIGGNARSVDFQIDTILKYLKKYFPIEYKNAEDGKYFLPNKVVYSDKNSDENNQNVSQGNATINDLFNKFNK